MEALVLAAVLAFSLVIAVASAWSALAVVMYLIDVTTATADVANGTEPAQAWVTEPAMLHEPPIRRHRSLAA